MSDASGQTVIRPYRPGDEEEILRSFNDVFKIDRPMSTWQWQFAQNPEGIYCYVADSDGRIVSQYAGIPRRTRYGADEGCFLEIVDSFTHPDYRRGLKKRGLFARAWEAFVERFGHPDRNALFYGLPNETAFRLGRRILTYEPVCELPILGKDLGSAGPAFHEELGDGARAATVGRFTDEVNALWEHASRWHDVINVRDSRYLNWRYSARHDVPYELVEFREASGHLFAVAALRHGWLSEAQSALCELLVDREHPLIPAAMRHVELRARRSGARILRAAARPGSHEGSGLLALGYTADELRFRFVAHTYDLEKLPLERIRDGMYLTLGDFDLV